MRDDRRNGLARSGIIFALLTTAAGAHAQNAVTQGYAKPSIADMAIRAGDTMAGGQVIVPSSSEVHPEDAGLRAHTHILVFAPGRAATAQPGAIPQSGATTPGAVGPLATPSGQPVANMFAETPASLACVYGLVPFTAGCNAYTLTTPASGGSRAIAIVDAYHSSSALTDLQTYSSQFGLPPPTLTVVSATGNTIPTDPTGCQTKCSYGWELEAALDLDMAHAMAPNAPLILVEAASNSNTDLLAAVDVAAQQVATAGGGEVSNSWGESEFSGETGFESHFMSSQNVVFLASTGDTPGTEWPSVSPNVVAAGGTSVSRNLDANLTYRLDTSWSEGGGGPSAYFSRPSYQNALAARIGSMRTVPDIAFDANPITGVWVSCSVSCGNSAGSWWYIVGGTSVSSPALAGIMNGAGSFLLNSAAELTRLYSNLSNPSTITDTQYGACGPRVAYLTRVATPSNPALQYDACTGLGTPHGRGAF
jgi:kumamolisin